MSEENNKSTNKLKKVITIIVSVCLLALSFGGGYLTYYLTQTPNQRQVSWFVGLIDENYLVYDEETGKIKDFTAEEYCDKIAELLDDYSTYYSSEDYAEIISTSLGNSYGIGVAFLGKESLEIASIVGNSPAEKVGLKRGMVIESITYGEKVETVNTFKQFVAVANQIPAQTDFILTVEYKGENLTFTISKQAFVKSYVRYYDSEKTYAFISDYGSTPVAKEIEGGISSLDDKTAYISLSHFEGDAYEQLSNAISYMQGRGRTKLIFDLRDNGGGYMDILQDIASYFINTGKKKNLVATAIYKDGSQENFNTNKNNFLNVEVCVIANDGSASATECLIGAMLHYGTIDYSHLVITKRGEVARTYGKGIMQTTWNDIFTGTATKLTVANIYWPDKTTCIHGVGIRTTEENSVPNALDKSLDSQLLRAIEILG